MSDEHHFLLQRVQPAMVGLIDGSLSTLAPIFSVAIVSHKPLYAFAAGLATSIGAAISMAFSEGLSDTGELTGRGRPVLRGSITGAGTVLEERSDLGEELVHHVAGAQERRRLPARVQVAAAAERDHLLGDRLDRLRLRDRRLDPAVLDQRAGEVRVERLAVRRVAPELLACASVAHVGS
jgi:hypothetical protein